MNPLGINYEAIDSLVEANDIDAWILCEYKEGRLSKNNAKRARKKLNYVMKRLYMGQLKHKCTACNVECDCGETNARSCLECSTCAGVGD